MTLTWNEHPLKTYFEPRAKNSKSSVYGYTKRIQTYITPQLWKAIREVIDLERENKDEIDYKTASQYVRQIVIERARFDYMYRIRRRQIHQNKIDKEDFNNEQFFVDFEVDYKWVTSEIKQMDEKLEELKEMARLLLEQRQQIRGKIHETFKGVRQDNARWQDSKDNIPVESTSL